MGIDIDIDDSEKDIDISMPLVGLVFDFLYKNVDGITLIDKSRSLSVTDNGVEKVLVCPDSFNSFNSLIKEDTVIEIFGQKFFARRRNNIIAIYNKMRIDNSLDVFDANLKTYMDNCYCGSGLSIVGSPSLIYNLKLLQVLYSNTPNKACCLYYSDNKYVITEYSEDGSEVLSSVCKEDIDSALNYILTSPYSFVFIEAYTGIDCLCGAIDLAVAGKNVTYIVSGASLVHAVYKATQTVDVGIFTSLYSGSLFLNTLSYIDKVGFPEIKFKYHRGYKKWSQLNSSPIEDNSIIISDGYPLNELCLGLTVLSEVAIKNKEFSSLISLKSIPADLASGLSLYVGWRSIAHEAFICVREKKASFDQVFEKITLV